MATIETLLEGFPGRSSRGFLGWSGCYLVTTGGGRRLLFDTAGYNERSTLLSELARRQIASETVNCVVLSHLHFDHAANWDLFPNADILVHERELAYANSGKADIALLRYHAPVLQQHPRLRVISAEEEIEVEEGIRVLHVPGHTPGSMALAIGQSILCGDALKSRWDLDGALGPPTWNPESARQSINKMQQLATRLYPGHDVPLELTAGQWRARGTPTVHILFLDGSERVVSVPESN